MQENGHRRPAVQAQAVVVYEAGGRAWPALVTGVWREPGQDERRPAVNLVLVSPDPRRVDPYGRAIERRTRVPHQSRAAGECWRYQEEPARVDAAVLAT